MGKVYSICYARFMKNNGEKVVPRELKNDADIMWNNFDSKNAYKRNLLQPINNKAKNCQVVYIDFKEKRKIA